ncbi:protein of unknown function [Burkholderia multivorans]
MAGFFIFHKIPFPTFRSHIHEYSQAFNSSRLSNYLKIRFAMQIPNRDFPDTGARNPAGTGSEGHLATPHTPADSATGTHLKHLRRFKSYSPPIPTSANFASAV